MEIIKCVHENNIIVLEIKGEVDAYTAQELNKTLLDLLNQGHHRIVMDVSKIIFISSTGIRAILFAHREAVQLGGEVRLVGPTDQVRRIFKIAGLFEVLQITDRLQESINNW
ncbi:STAS domain-containing protein [Chloroflexota bacterium]